MTAPAWAPTLAEVGAIMHSRTIEEGTGAQLGTFTTATSPTAAQVEILIEDACNEILDTNAQTIAAACEGSARTAVKWLTAMMIELSHFTNQVGDDPDAYDRFKENYERSLATLGTCLVNAVDPDTEDASDAATGYAEGGFPGLVGTTLREEF